MPVLHALNLLLAMPPDYRGAKEKARSLWREEEEGHGGNEASSAVEGEENAEK